MKMTEKLLEETRMLNYSDRSIQRLIEKKNWKQLDEFDRIRQIYGFVRDGILFGYNADDSIPASKVLADGYGQCNTKATLLMTLLRACGIPCRVHGFAVDKRFQNGAATGFVYRLAPAQVFHSWAEVYFEGQWYALEGAIIDSEYLGSIQRQNRNCGGPFWGYAIAVKDLNAPPIGFDRNSTYIQSESITQDFGVYDSPDEMLKVHHQEYSGWKAFGFRHLGRHLMNRNVKRIRKGYIKPLA